MCLRPLDSRRGEFHENTRVKCTEATSCICLKVLTAVCGELKVVAWKPQWARCIQLYRQCGWCEWSWPAGRQKTLKVPPGQTCEGRGLRQQNRLEADTSCFSTGLGFSSQRTLGGSQTSAIAASENLKPFETTRHSTAHSITAGQPRAQSDKQTDKYGSKAEARSCHMDVEGVMVNAGWHVCLQRSHL